MNISNKRYLIKLMNGLIIFLLTLSSVYSDVIMFQNSTKFHNVKYFTFPWYQNGKLDWWNVKMDNLFYNFTVSNNYSDTFVVVTPFIDWNRICINCCYLDMNISYMGYELWGVFVKSPGDSYMDYNVTLHYHISPIKHHSPYISDPLLPLWIILGVVGGFTVALLTALCCCRHFRKKEEQEYSRI